jgi:hypothetical protein
LQNIQVVKVEERLNQRFAFSVRVDAGANHMEFPIDIQDKGSATGNEQGNGFTSEGVDRTAHAERLLAARHRSLAFLTRCTPYTVAEPCATCAGDLLGRLCHAGTRLPNFAGRDSPLP